ncbi:MAG TPA: hypothetical protein VJ045_11540 [Hyphomicrobiaceae bacterium]|nr:hypothetical protein [Hyphomicrobiaceae bacterium]
MTVTINSLMSAAHAAGFAMAPSVDYLDETDPPAPVVLADRPWSRPDFGAAPFAHSSPPRRWGELDIVVEPVRAAWFRDFLTGWWAGKAAA